MALGLTLMIGGGYLAVMTALWYPLYAALEEARLRYNRREFALTAHCYDNEHGTSILGASMLALFWFVALVPLLSMRFWTGHWFPVTTKESTRV